MTDHAWVVGLEGLLERPAAGRVWPACVALLLAALAAVVWWIGHAPQSSYPWSSAILLDGGWRVALGQVPHQDFHSPVGFGYLGLIATPMRAWGAGIDAIAQAVALTVPLVGMAAWWIASRRMSAVAAAVATTWIALVWCSVGTLGSLGLADITYGGHYSRLCWALMALVMIAVAAPARGGGMAWEWLLLGAVAGALCVTKITFAAAAGAMLAIMLVLRPGLPRWAAAVCLAGGWAGLQLLAWLASGGGSLIGYLADLAAVGRANTTGMPSFLLVEVLSLDAVPAAALAAVLLLLGPSLGGPGAILRWTGLAALGACGLLLSGTSGCETMTPTLVLLPVAGCLLAGAWFAADPLRPRHAWLVPALLLSLLVLVGDCVRLGRPLASLARERLAPPVYALASALDGPYHGRRFLLSGMDPAAGDQPLTSLTRNAAAVTGEAYLHYVRSGCAAIQVAKGGDGCRVLSLDFANPFPFTMRLPPPRGDLIYWHVGRNVGAASHPSPAALFADVDLVIEPVRPIVAESLAFKREAYLPWLREHAVVASTSPWWNIWKIIR